MCRGVLVLINIPKVRNIENDAPPFPLAALANDVPK
jgi:hypothetical protein